MSVLITGGAGYIGSHTCVELLNQNEDIIVVDNFSNSSPYVINKIREITGKDFLFYQMDIRNKSDLIKIFQENQIDEVIHFAGFKSVGESVSKPLFYYNNNIVSTLVLLEVMMKYNCRKIVFSSSATVYGEAGTIPITEKSPLLAINPYGRTKLIIEDILKDLYKSDNSYSIAILRYFNPVGAHTSGKIGERPNGIPNNLMPYISQVAAGKLDILSVFGNDYDTVDGTGVRDYIHVMDLATGHLKALNWIRENTKVDEFNLGTGNGYSVKEIIKAFENSTGVKLKYKIVDRRPGDVAKCYADTNKANQILGFKAKKNIYDMCKDSWNFVVSNN